MFKLEQQLKSVNNTHGGYIKTSYNMALQHLKKMFILTQFRKVGQDGSQFNIFVYPTLVCCLLFDMFMSAFSIHNTLLLFLLYRVNRVLDSVNSVQCVYVHGYISSYRYILYFKQYKSTMILYKKSPTLYC